MSITDEMKSPAAGASSAGTDGPVDGSEQTWTRVITPNRGLLSFPVREVWAYRDLLRMLVYRDFVAQFKQTVLGPAWFVLQPLMMTLVFSIVFGNIAQISTDGLPHTLFYLAGITCWTYFAETLTKVADTFTVNANMFGKVYFPRVVVPLSVVASNLMKFAVQFGIFVIVLFWFILSGADVAPNWAALLLPLILLIMAMLGLGFGMIITALTTKYRDLKFLLTFGIQLAMYASPVIYPLSVIPDAYRPFIWANPVTPLIETFRYGFLGQGAFDPLHLGYALLFATALLALASMLFNQVEKTFMDTV